MASIAFANPTRHRLSGLCSRIAGGADHSNLLVTDVQRARRLQSPVRSRDRRVSNSGAWCRHLVQTTVKGEVARAIYLPIPKLPTADRPNRPNPLR